MSEELINKYRPTGFDEVVGQDAVCKSVRLALKNERGRTFLFSGPPGVGKTTLGRLIAARVEADPIDVIEVDGATNTGIDAMRDVMSHLGYSTISGGPKVIIVDECHAISQQAFKSMLKVLEEPPENVYWVLCTTEIDKVPKAVRTRCLSYVLKAVASGVITDLLIEVAKAEKLTIRRNSDALEVISQASEGSPREALSTLAKCGHLKTVEAVEDLIEAGGLGSGSKEAIDLCRLLLGGGSWKSLIACISGMETPPETVRIIILRYMSTVALKGSKDPGHILSVMEEFSQPFLDREGKAPLLLACGRLALED